jgi:glycosyltransferase involved in cell wall biosynthesis
VLATVPADAAGYREAGVSAARLHVCGLPVPPLSPSEAAVRLPVSDDAPVVLFLGARRAAKGWELLLESAPLVWRRAPRARFAFVGPGEDVPRGDERILDVGRVSETERAAWIRRATVLCLPSAWESFGLVVAEAWSESVPVVVSDTPVLRELVDSSGGGVVAARHPQAIAAAVAGLLEQPEQAREMGRAGRRFWQREFDPLAVGRRHLAIYDDLIRRGATR